MTSTWWYRDFFPNDALSSRHGSIVEFRNASDQETRPTLKCSRSLHFCCPSRKERLAAPFITTVPLTNDPCPPPSPRLPLRWTGGCRPSAQLPQDTPSSVPYARCETAPGMRHRALGSLRFGANSPFGRGKWFVARAAHSRPILTFLLTALFCEMSLSECETPERPQISPWQRVSSEIECIPIRWALASIRLWSSLGRRILCIAAWACYTDQRIAFDPWKVRPSAKPGQRRCQEYGPRNLACGSTFCSGMFLRIV